MFFYVRVRQSDSSTPNLFSNEGTLRAQQHLRGLGTEGNSLQYGSFIINSEIATQKLREKTYETRGLMTSMALTLRLSFESEEAAGQEACLLLPPPRGGGNKCITAH